jgi:hypothetical protein
MFVLRAHLEHLAIVSWAVPSERIGAMLPHALVPSTIDAAGKWAVFSMAVMFDSTGGQPYTQVNERAYVRRRDGTGEGAFFWKSHANTSQADLYRWLLGIPEFHDDVTLRVAGDRYTCTFDGRTVLELDLGRQGAIPPWYGDIKGKELKKAWEMSRNPLIGYTLDWGELCETPVQHNIIPGRPVLVRSVDPSFMVPAIALDPGQAATPIFVVYEKATPFYIRLPPRPVAGWCRLVTKLFYGWKP